MSKKVMNRIILMVVLAVVVVVLAFAIGHLVPGSDKSAKQEQQTQGTVYTATSDVTVVPPGSGDGADGAGQ